MPNRSHLTACWRWMFDPWWSMNETQRISSWYQMPWNVKSRCSWLLLKEHAYKILQVLLQFLRNPSVVLCLRLGGSPWCLPRWLYTLTRSCTTAHWPSKPLLKSTLCLATVSPASCSSARLVPANLYPWCISAISFCSNRCHLTTDFNELQWHVSSCLFFQDNTWIHMNSWHQTFKPQRFTKLSRIGFSHWNSLWNGSSLWDVFLGIFHWVPPTSLGQTQQGWTIKHVPCTPLNSCQVVRFLP